MFVLYALSLDLIFLNDICFQLQNIINLLCLYVGAEVSTGVDSSKAGNREEARREGGGVSGKLRS